MEDVLRTSQSEFIVVENPYEKDREKREFWESLTLFVKSLEKNSSVIKNENDRKVISSIEYMLENMDKLEILNKKAIYLNCGS